MANLHPAGFAWELDADTNTDALAIAAPLATSIENYAAGNTRGKHRCPICLKEYGQKKTLNRHFESVHRKAKYQCKHTNCSKAFARRDYRTRHEAERHDRSSHTVRCTVCDMDLLARSWDEHCKSITHRQAERQSDDLMCLALQTWRQADIVQMPATESLIDPLLITTWFFWKLNLDCSQATWDGSNGHFKPSSDVLNLKGLATRVLIRKLKDYHDHELSHLIRAVEIMTVAEAMISGWEIAKPHKKALRCLRTEQNLRSKDRQIEMISHSLTIAIILSNLAGVTPVNNDMMVAPATHSGPAISLTPPAWYYKNVLYNGMTQTIHDPALFTCGLRDEKIKNKWHGIPPDTMLSESNEYRNIEPTFPTFQHDLDPGLVDSNSLSFCWGGENTAALSAASTVVRRNLHAFLCMSTTTAFVPAPKARIQQLERSHGVHFPRSTSTRVSKDVHLHKGITTFRAAPRAQEDIMRPPWHVETGWMLGSVGHHLEYLSLYSASRTFSGRQELFGGSSSKYMAS